MRAADLKSESVHTYRVDLSELCMPVQFLTSIMYTVLDVHVRNAGSYSEVRGQFIESVGGIYPLICHLCSVLLLPE